MDFNFDIRYVCQQADIPVLLGNRKAYDTDCPFCGRTKKLHIDAEKNVFRCNYCNVQGGMLKLYQLMFGLHDTKEAYDILTGKITPEIKTQTQVRKEIYLQSNERKTADIDSINDVYTALLNKLSLAKRHKNSLMARGFDEDAIKKFGYKSVQQVGAASLAKSIFNEGKNCIGVPGFYSYQNYTRIVSSDSGFYVPVRTIDGKISGMQIRHDNIVDGRKYTWLSSTHYENGAAVKGASQIHYVGFNLSNPPKKVCITEGALKADIASFLTGMPFIAILGVNNTSNLANALSGLKEIGVEEIFECFDMDYFTNEHVKAAIDKAHNIIKDSDLKTQRLSWNRKYKGIDDYMLARKSKI